MPEFGHFFRCIRLFVNFRPLFIYLFILFSFTSNDNEIKFTAKVRKNKESPAHGQFHYVFKGNKTLIVLKMQDFTLILFRQSVDILESWSPLIHSLFIF